MAKEITAPTSQADTNQQWMNYWNNKGPRPTGIFTGWASYNSQEPQVAPPVNLPAKPRSPYTPIAPTIPTRFNPFALGNPNLANPFAGHVYNRPGPTTQTPTPNWLQTLGNLFSGLGASSAEGGQGFAPQFATVKPNASNPALAQQNLAQAAAASPLATKEMAINHLAPNAITAAPAENPVLLQALADLGIELPLPPKEDVPVAPAPPSPIVPPGTPFPSRPGGNPNLNQLLGSDQFRLWYNEPGNSDYWNTLTDDEKGALIDYINSTTAIPGHPNMTRYPGFPNNADRVAAGATRGAKEQYNTVPSLPKEIQNPYPNYGQTPYGNNYYDIYYGGSSAAPAHWLTNLTNWNIT